MLQNRNLQYVRAMALHEVVALAAMVSIAACVLAAPLDRLDQSKHRTACLANLKMIARGGLIYAEMNRGPLPVALHDPEKAGGATSIGGAENFLKPDMADGKNDESNTRGWYKLWSGGKKAMLQPKQAVCPEAISAPSGNEAGPFFHLIFAGSYTPKS
jgi:hypothetical protein